MKDKVCERCGVVHTQKPFNEKDAVAVGLAAIMEAEDKEWRKLADEKFREMGINPEILDTEIGENSEFAEHLRKMNDFRARFAANPQKLAEAIGMQSKDLSADRYKAKPHQLAVIEALKNHKGPLHIGRFIGGMQVDKGPTLSLRISPGETKVMNDRDELLEHLPFGYHDFEQHMQDLQSDFVERFGGKSQYLHISVPHNVDPLNRVHGRFAIDTGNGSGIVHGVNRMRSPQFEQMPKHPLLTDVKRFTPVDLDGEFLPKRDFGDVMFTIDSIPQDWDKVTIEGEKIRLPETLNRPFTKQELESEFIHGMMVAENNRRHHTFQFKALDEAVKVRPSKGPRSWPGERGDRGPAGKIVEPLERIAGPTGKPKRSKAKCKAQRKARKGNRK